MKREPLMTEEYFDKDISFIENAITKRVINLRNDPKQYQKIQLVYYSLFKYKYQLIISKYSRGFKISDLKSDFAEMLVFWEQYMNHPLHEMFLFEKSLEDFELGLWLFSIGVLLKIDASIIARLLKCINNEGRDALFQRLVSRYHQEESMNNDKSDNLVYPKIYKSLYDSTIVDTQSAERNVQAFLKNWYSNMKKCYWYENHKGKDGGGFFGYWCWEAALITYLWNLDDSSYRYMSYYPKDMVAYARNDSQ